MKLYAKQSLVYTSMITTMLTILTFVLHDAHALFKIIFLVGIFAIIHNSHGILFYNGAIHGVDEAVKIIEKGRQSKPQKKPRGVAK